MGAGTLKRAKASGRCLGEGSCAGNNMLDIECKAGGRLSGSCVIEEAWHIYEMAGTVSVVGLLCCACIAAGLLGGACGLSS